MYTVYSKPACPLCDKAKFLLKQKNITFREIVLDVGQSKTEGLTYMPVQEFKDAHPYAKTVPQIFFNDNGTDINIGGFTELKNHLGET